MLPCGVSQMSAAFQRGSGTGVGKRGLVTGFRSQAYSVLSLATPLCACERVMRSRCRTLW